MLGATGKDQRAVGINSGLGLKDPGAGKTARK